MPINTTQIAIDDGNELNTHQITTDDVNIESRLVIGSDGHWGRNMDGSLHWETAHNNALDRIEAIHEQRPIDVFIYHGDMVTYDTGDHQEVIDQFFTELPSDTIWYLTHGNHDIPESQSWQSIYQTPIQHTFQIGKQRFLIIDSGTE